MADNILRILAVGDVTGPAGLLFVERNIKNMREETGADIVTVNGENAAKGNGIDLDAVNRLRSCGADVITTGNHVFKWRNIYPLLDSSVRGFGDGAAKQNPSLAPVLRPLNYPDTAPGRGWVIVDAGGFRLLVMNALGTVFMDAVNPPMDAAASALTSLEGMYDAAVIDFHAEATSEKAAFARYIGEKFPKAAAVWGTHTHVPTADCQILPCGTAFISDIGMTGPVDSILGVKPDVVINRFVTKLPTFFEFAGGKCASDTVLIEIDRQSGRAVSIRGMTF